MKKLLTICLSLLSISLFSQAPKIKDDPRERMAFEYLKTKNPTSGKVPENIRAKEIEFSSNLLQKARTLGASNTWTHRGPFNVGGRTRALAVSSVDENLILAGGVSGGMWRSTDQGSTWTKVSSASDLLSISCIAQDPTQTNTWYYGTGEFSGNSASGDGAFFFGDGIYKSTDNGVSWSVLSSTVSDSPEIFDTNGFDINNEIIVNPSNGDVLVANYGGIQRSQNGGTSFTEVLDNPNSGWSDIATTSTGILFATAEGDGIYKSINNGDSWTDITDASYPLADGERIELAIAPSNEDILYAIAEDGSGHSLWKFDDSSDTWTDLSAQIPMLGGSVGDFDSQGGYDLLVAVDSTDENFVIIGGTNLYRSTDGFTTTGNTDWVGGYSTMNNVSLYTNQHPDQHAFIFLSGTKALSGNDGGVQITSDITDVTANGAGETVDWTWLNSGYLTTQVYALSVGPGDQIMSGFQDNSTWLTISSSGTANWSDQFSGDGAYNAWSNDGTDRYVSAQRAVIYRQEYTDANDETLNSFQQIDPDPSLGYPDDVSEFSLFITPFYLDPANDEILYLGGDEMLFVNTQASTATTTAGWKSIDLSATGRISEFGLTNAGIVYVGTENGELFRVVNPEGTESFTNITDAQFPSNAYISSIGVNPQDEDELIVTFSSYEVKSIFHSIDGGTSWTDVSGNLEENVDGSGSGPSVRAARIVGNGFEYYVGTSTGLYSTKTLNGTSTVWVQEGSTSIGNVVINHIVTKDNGLMVVGTHGNGVYSAMIPFDPDLTVASLDEPTSMPLGLNDVVVTIENIGGMEVTSFDVSLTVNSNPIVTDNVVATINASDTYQHTFSAQVDFSALGTYDFEITVTAPGDSDSGNDMLSTAIVSEAAPTDIALDNSTIDEEQDSGTVIGSFSTTDADDEDPTTHTYTLVDGEGDDDNASFSISDNELLSATIFDFEARTPPTYLIRVETADDDGNTFAESFSIEVIDVLGIENLENAGITMFPNPFKNQINLEMVNEYLGVIKVTVYNLEGRKLMENSYDKQRERTTSLLDLKHLPSGSYLIKFNMEGRDLTAKLIKE